MPPKSVPLSLWNSYQSDGLQSQFGGMLDALQRTLSEATQPIAAPVQQAIPDTLPSLPTLDDLTKHWGASADDQAPDKPASSGLSLPSLDDLTSAWTGPKDSRAATTPAATVAPPRVGAPAQTGGDLQAHARQVAAKYGVDPDILDRQLGQESGYQPDVVSPAGARGPGQFMPATAAGVARQLGVTLDQFWADPKLQVEGAALHMRDLLAANGGDYRRALAAYNAGQGAVDKYNGVPPYAETQQYLNIILGNGAAPPTAGAGAVNPAPAAPSQAPAAAASSPAQQAAGDPNRMITVRHKGTGATSQVLAATWNPRDVTNYNEFDVVPDTMPKLSDQQMSDDPNAPSPGDQKRAKRAAGDGRPVPMPDGSAPYTWQPPERTIPIQGSGPQSTEPVADGWLPPDDLMPGGLPPGTSGQRTIVPYNPQTQNVGNPDGTHGVQYRQPLQATMGADTGQGDYADPDQGPRESGYTVPSGDASSVAGSTPAGGDAAPVTQLAETPGVAAPATYGQSSDDPGAAPVQAQPAPFTPPPGLQAVYDAAGNFLHWIQGAADQIGQNMAGNQQAVTDANAGQSGGVNFGQGIANALPVAEQALDSAVAGGLPQISRRMREIEQAAGAAQGITDPVRSMRAPNDPTWRAQNPEMAQEYDDLQSQYTLGVGGSVGAGGEKPAPRPRPQQTVETLQQRVEQANSIVQRLLGSGDAERLAMAQENRAALEAELIDAQNARKALEPAISSDVGPRESRVPPSEQTVENRMDAVRPLPDAPMRPEDLSGPVSIPVNPSERLNSGVGASGARGVLPTLANAAQGGVLGAASEDLQAQQEGREPDPTQRALRAAGGAGLAVLAGRAMRPGEGRMRLGSGVVPEGEASAARYRPELTREPVMPGFEPPRRVAGDAGPPVSETPSGPRSLADIMANPERDVGFPEMPDANGPREVAMPASAGDAQALSEMRATRSPGLPSMQEHPGVLARVAEAVSPWANRVNIVRYAGMLSDTALHVMNTAGNATLAGVDLAATPIAVGIDAARSGITGAPREVFMAELGARFAGQRAGASTGLQAAADLMAGRAAKAETQIVNGRVVSATSTKLDHATEGFGTNIPGIAPAGSTVAKATDFAFEAPLRALAAADAVFRTSAAGGHLAAEATAAAMKANGGKSVTPEMIREAMKNPQLLDRVNYLASRSVLQEPRAVTTWLSNTIRKAPPGVGAALSTEIPFRNTPYNVVAQGMGLSPLGFAGLLQDMAEHKAPREMEYRAARAALGTATAAVAFSAYGAGSLTGPRPSDPKEASTLPPGWAPWSWKVPLPGGGTYYFPLSYLGPLALGPVMAILAGEEAKKGDLMTIEGAGNIARGLGQYAAQQTFFQALANTGSLLDNRNGSPGKAIERHVQQIVAQYSPHILGGGAIGSELQQIMGMPLRDPHGVKEALLAKFPYTADQVQPQQDVIGRPRVTAPSGLVRSIIRGSVENDAPVIRAFRRVKTGLPMGAPPTLKDEATQATKTLTPAQKSRWQRVFGAALREGYQGYGNPSDADTLRKVEGDARQAANETVLGQR